MAEAIALFNEMRSEPDNKLCFECGKVNPQWASVPFGIIVCLECAGGHRSLGVHLSFVRSLTMDSWNDKQLASMRSGGNGRCKAFFQKYQIVEGDLNTKYSSSVAQAYKAKIKALSENTPWEDPSPAELEKKFPAISTAKPSFSLNNSRGNEVQGPRVAPPGVGPSSAAQERLYTDYGNSTSIGSKDLFGSGNRNGGSGRNYGQSSMGSMGSRQGQSPAQGTDWDYFSSGWDTLSTAAATASASVSAQIQQIDLEEVKSNLATTTEKGWGFALDVFNVAAQYVGEGVGQLSKMAETYAEQYQNPDQQQQHQNDHGLTPPQQQRSELNVSSEGRPRDVSPSKPAPAATKPSNTPPGFRQTEGAYGTSVPAVRKQQKEGEDWDSDWGLAKSKEETTKPAQPLSKGDIDWDSW